MSKAFFDILEAALKKDERFVSQEGNLLRSEIVEKALAIDPKLIELLLSEKTLKEEFFVKIKDSLVFDINKFTAYIQDKNFLNDSFTQFKNKIGLNIGKKFLKEREEVCLVFPFKDCVLEGGQTTEEQSRKEIFFNQILAKDEINRLLDPKVITNAEYWDLEAVKANKPKQVKGFNRNEKGEITDNLLIKGNNLLALHTIKHEFAGKVKLIYIDPPYNTGSKNDTFCYNNNFKRSSWLTFMKNRLEAAKTLLRKDGALACAIDENEMVYLGVLLKEIFPESDYETHCITIVHNPRGIQGTNFSYTNEYAFFVIPKGIKTIGNRKIDEKEIDWRNLRDNGGESERTDAKNCFYPIIIGNDKIIGFGDVLDDKEHPKAQTIKKDDKFYLYPIDKEGVERKWRYARQSVEDIKNLLRAKKTKNGYEVEIGKDFGMYRTVWIDPRYDSNEYGTKIIHKLVPDCNFDFPKSLYNVYDCLYAVVGQDKNAIVLDFFGGSGTTAHALLKMNKEDSGNRRFILIEQMDYIKNMPEARIKKVIETETPKENFVYMEMKPLNEKFMDSVQKAKDGKELLAIWEDMKANSFITYNVDIKQMEANLEEFKKLSIEEQKHALCEMLDKNQLYLNLSEIEDSTYHVSEEDKKLNKDFYKKLK